MHRRCYELDQISDDGELNIVISNPKRNLNRFFLLGVILLTVRPKSKVVLIAPWPWTVLQIKGHESNWVSLFLKPEADNFFGALFHKAVTQSSTPEDGRNYRPKHVELIEIANKIIIFASSRLFILLLIYNSSNAENFEIQSDFSANHNLHLMLIRPCIILIVE